MMYSTVPRSSRAPPLSPTASGTTVLNECRVILNQGEFLVDLLKNHKSGAELLPDQLEPLVERAREAVQGAANVLEAIDNLNSVAKTGNKISAHHPKELQASVAGLTRSITTALSGRRAIDAELIRGIEAQLSFVKEAIRNVVLAIEAWKVAEGRAERKQKAEEQVEGLQERAAGIARSVKEILVMTKGAIVPEEFVGKARATLNELDTLVEIASDLGLLQQSTDLRNAAVAFISAATQVLKTGGADDSELNEAVKQVAVNMRALLSAIEDLKPKNLLQDRSQIKKSNNNVEKNVRMRGQALREMFETENTYLEQMKTLNSGFWEPLQKLENPDKQITQFLQQRPVIDVMGALPKMVSLTQTIRDDLLTAMAAMDPDIGYIFLQLGPNLECYQHYINNITLVEEKIEKLMKRSNKFDTFVKDFLKGTTAPTLGFFLILPIQRPPRYELLLKELSKYSNSEGLGGENMAAAFKLINEINQVINQRKKEDENRKTIKALQKTIKAEVPLKLYLPGRWFVRQGAMVTVKSKKIRKGNKLGNKLHYFMFNDILVQAKPQGGVLRSLTYQYKKTISFEKFTLKDEPNDPKGGVENMFSLVADQDQSTWSPREKKKNKPPPAETYRFSCATEEEKRGWVRDIEEAISVNKLMNKITGGNDPLRGGTVRKGQQPFVISRN